MKSFGIELGIRAPQGAVVEAGNLAKFYDLDYYFVPETHPDHLGVDAFKSLCSVASPYTNTVIGTAVVNVFSRSKQEILARSLDLHQETRGKFVAGIGTSAPAIVTRMYNAKFEKPVERMKDYTRHIKDNSNVPVFWGVVGNVMTKYSAALADGVIFFMKPEEDLKNSVDMVNGVLIENGRDADQFEIASIRPTYLVDNERDGFSRARITLANYIGANEFYSRGFSDEELKNNSEEIKKEFSTRGLLAASEKVSRKMVEELATYGSEDKCFEELAEYSRATGVKTVIAGFDYPKSSYDQELFRKIGNLAENFRCSR